MLIKIVDVIIYFALFSFLGWVCETIYCSIPAKKFVYRGFLNMPICPIYGFGGLIVVYILAPVKESIIILFFLGMICTTALEYITSWLLEKLFEVTLWNYSEKPLNINGRVCLPYSVMFGLLGLLAVRLIYPVSSRFVEIKMPQTLKIVLAGVFLVLIVADTFATVVSMLDLKTKLAEIEVVLKKSRELEKLKITAAIEELKKVAFEERYKREEQKQKALSDIRAKLSELSVRNPLKNISTKRLLKAFPNARSKKLKEAFEEYRKEIDKKS